MMMEETSVIIQCAMGMEAQPFLDALEPQSKEYVVGNEKYHQQRFVQGVLDGCRVLIVVSGIGLAHAASATARALSLVWHSHESGQESSGNTDRLERSDVLSMPDTMVLIAGTCGGLGTDVEVGDIILGTEAVYNGADATAFGYQLGQIPQMPPNYLCGEEVYKGAQDILAGVNANDRGGQTVHSGLVLSGDSFVSGDLVHSVRASFPNALGTDMETCAIAEVCYGLGVQWLGMRAVSDLCGPKAGQMFHIGGERAAQMSADAVQKVVAALAQSVG